MAENPKKRKLDILEKSITQHTTKRRQTAKHLIDASRANINKLSLYKVNLADLRKQIITRELEMVDNAKRRVAKRNAMMLADIGVKELVKMVNAVNLYEVKLQTLNLQTIILGY